MSDHAFCKTCKRVVYKEHIFPDGNCSEHTTVATKVAPPPPAPKAQSAPDEGETD